MGELAEKESGDDEERGRHGLSGCGSCIDDGQVTLRNKRKRTKSQQKQTKAKERKTKERKADKRNRKKQKQRRKANKTDECVNTAS
jgi:hypothetical protein